MALNAQLTINVSCARMMQPFHECNTLEHSKTDQENTDLGLKHCSVIGVKPMQGESRMKSVLQSFKGEIWELTCRMTTFLCIYRLWMCLNQRLWRPSKLVGGGGRGGGALNNAIQYLLDLCSKEGVAIVDTEWLPADFMGIYSMVYRYLSLWISSIIII
jgi:hypothetical protein